MVNADPEDPLLRGDFPVMVDAADSPARVATVLDSLRCVSRAWWFVFVCGSMLFGRGTRSTRCLLCEPAWLLTLKTSHRLLLCSQGGRRRAHLHGLWLRRRDDQQDDAHPGAAAPGSLAGGRTPGTVRLAPNLSSRPSPSPLSRSHPQRPQIGAAVFARSDVAIVTNASPRRELPEEIIADVMDGLPEKVGCMGWGGGWGAGFGVGRGVEQLVSAKTPNF